jgi:hypothetical protein
MNGYELSRQWWDFAYGNPEKVKPIHSALYFFAINQCNRLGWAEKFALPAYMAMGALGVSHHNTYSKAFDDLVEWGFFHLVQKSKNQHTANIIALSKIDTALYTALDTATLNHLAEQAHEQGDSTITINKQQTTNQKQQTTNAAAPSKKRKPKEPVEFTPPTLQEVKDYFKLNGYTQDAAERAFRHYETRNWIKSNDKPVDNWKNTMGNNWFKPENKEPTTTSRYQTYNPEIHK